MRTNILFSTLALLLFSTTAHAGLYLEPYVGYGMGSNKADYTVSSFTNSINASNAKATVFGGKLGMSILMFRFGADYMSTSGTEEAEDKLGAKSNDTVKTTNIGAFVGVGFPFIQLSATYFLSSKATVGIVPTNSNPSSDLSLSGNGIKAGIGFTGIPIIAINLEMINLGFSKGSYTQGSQSGDFASFSSKYNLTMLSISAPFSF